MSSRLYLRQNRSHTVTDPSMSGEYPSSTSSRRISLATEIKSSDDTLSIPFHFLILAVRLRCISYEVILLSLMIVSLPAPVTAV